MLVNFDTTFAQDLERVYILRNELGYAPYIMVYDKPNCSAKYRRLQRWCNWMPFAAKFDTFEEFSRTMYKTSLEGE